MFSDGIWWSLVIFGDLWDFFFHFLKKKFFFEKKSCFHNHVDGGVSRNLYEWKMLIFWKNDLWVTPINLVKNDIFHADHFWDTDIKKSVLMFWFWYFLMVFDGFWCFFWKKILLIDIGDNLSPNLVEWKMFFFSENDLQIAFNNLRKKNTYCSATEFSDLWWSLVICEIFFSLSKKKFFFWKKILFAGRCWWGSISKSIRVKNVNFLIKWSLSAVF